MTSSIPYPGLNCLRRSIHIKLARLSGIGSIKTLWSWIWILSQGNDELMLLNIMGPGGQNTSYNSLRDFLAVFEALQSQKPVDESCCLFESSIKFTRPLVTEHNQIFKNSPHCLLNEVILR